MNQQESIFFNVNDNTYREKLKYYPLSESFQKLNFQEEIKERSGSESEN